MLQSRLQSSLQSDYAKSTSSFFSNILTTTSSKYNTLRRQLTSSEADGDTPDDSHIARALRAYYTEKGRVPLPEWIPADPKAPPPVAAPTMMVSSAQGGQAIGQQGRFGRSGGLSDLWGDGAKSAPPTSASDSLRQRPGISPANSSGSRFANPSVQSLGPPQEARPLPSQRAGSYQTQGSGRYETASPPPSAGSGATAKEKLQARLWGTNRTASPPAQMSNTPSYGSAGSGSSAGRNPYENAGSGGGRNPYENPGSSGGSGGRNPYVEQGQGGARYTGGGNPQSGRAPASANSPWSGGGDPYGGSGGRGGGNGGGGYDSGGGGRQQNSGVPAGLRPGRQPGVGLPSGPRPQRN